MHFTGDKEVLLFCWGVLNIGSSGSTGLVMGQLSPLSSTSA